jgi:peptidoglycan/LPS O-acetylase OafA/YrhL
VKTLGAAFDPRANGLNAVRLGLAATVIVYHAFVLSGREIHPRPVFEALHGLPVDGFFAISGFLIVSSWVRNPQWLPFLRARALRILPGLYACLIVTAVVLAPLGLLLGGQGLPDGYVPAAVAYVLDGLDLRVGIWSIAGTPTGVPNPGVWNGSVWTLFWEALCYVSVLVAGIVGAFKWRWSIPVVFVLATAGQVLVDLGPLDGNFWTKYLSRFGLMFAAGALVWLWQDRLPVGRWWATGALAVLVGALVFLPDYRAVGAFPLAYLALYAGAVARHPRWRLRNDLSYGVYIYGCVVQQMIALAGGIRWGVAVYAVLSLIGTLPLAAASWWWVEKPALRWKKAAKPPVTVQEEAVVDAQLDPIHPVGQRA